VRIEKDDVVDDTLSFNVNSLMLKDQRLHRMLTCESNNLTINSLK
jgi:hypothetical protein